LLGVVSRTPARLSDLLADDLAPFTALAAEHKDGWGVAYWGATDLPASGDAGAGTDLAIVKSQDPAHTSMAFARTVAGVSTDAALLHIRMATPGLAVNLDNTHPFTTGPIAFVHNGEFTPPEAINALIDPDLLSGAQGTTDSERFFLLVRTHLRDSDPATALALAAADIRDRAGIVGLNCLMLTPEALYAYVEYNPEAEVFQRREPDYLSLHYRVEPDHFVVASTGWPQPEPAWTLLPEREVLEIRRGSLRVTRHRVTVAVPAQRRGDGDGDGDQPGRQLAGASQSGGDM
jgi:predicted glutamine amidotransferase